MQRVKVLQAGVESPLLLIGYHRAGRLDPLVGGVEFGRRELQRRRASPHEDVGSGSRLPLAIAAEWCSSRLALGLIR
jgi:hypothetical protein